MKKKIIVGIFILLAVTLGGSGVATAKIKEGKQNEDILERNENVTTASDVEYGYANSILKYKQYCRLIEGAGEIDWTIAIYEALKEGTVFFPEGTYYISNDIVLTQEGVGLYGVGPKSVIRACAGAKFNEAMICIRNSFVEIKNMRICGRSEEKKVNTHIIKTGSRVDTGAKTNYVKLLNVMVNYSERTGVCVDDAYDVIIDGCYSSFNNCGISFGGTDSQISNCYASFNKEDGFRLYGGLNQMTNCKSYFNDGVGYFGNAYDYSLVNQQQ